MSLCCSSEKEILQKLPEINFDICRWEQPKIYQKRGHFLFALRIKDYFIFGSQLHERICYQLWNHSSGIFRLITALGWEYAILCVAGLVLTCIAFGCLMRPLESGQTSSSKVKSFFLKMCSSSFFSRRRMKKQKKKSLLHSRTELQERSQQQQKMEKLKMDISSFHLR